MRLLKSPSCAGAESLSRLPLPGSPPTETPTEPPTHMLGTGLLPHMPWELLVRCCCCKAVGSLGSARGSRGSTRGSLGSQRGWAGMSRGLRARGSSSLTPANTQRHGHGLCCCYEDPKCIGNNDILASDERSFSCARAALRAVTAFTGYV